METDYSIVESLSKKQEARFNYLDRINDNSTVICVYNGLFYKSTHNSVYWDSKFLSWADRPVYTILFDELVKIQTFEDYKAINPLGTREMYEEEVKYSWCLYVPEDELTLEQKEYEFKEYDDDEDTDGLFYMDDVLSSNKPKFEIGDPIRDGVIVSILHPIFLHMSPSQNLMFWNTLYPNWYTKPVYSVVLNEKQPVYTLEQFQQVYPFSKKLHFENNFVDSRSFYLPEDSLINNWL